MNFPTEDSLVKQRLFTPTSQIIKSLNSTIKRGVTLVSLLKNNQENQIEDTLLQLLQSINDLSTILQLQNQLIHAYSLDKQEYAQDATQIQNQSTQFNHSIENKKQQLINALIDKNNKKEYDEISEKILAIPSRLESIQGMEKLEKQLEGLKREGENLEKEFEVKAKLISQFVKWGREIKEVEVEHGVVELLDLQVESQSVGSSEHMDGEEGMEGMDGEEMDGENGMEEGALEDILEEGEAMDMS